MAAALSASCCALRAAMRSSRSMRLIATSLSEVSRMMLVCACAATAMSSMALTMMVAVPMATCAHPKSALMLDHSDGAAATIGVGMVMSLELMIA